MWSKIEDERLTRKGIDPLQADEGGELVARRWVHTDGRYAMHVPGADPEILVLDAEGETVKEYDLPGQGAEPDDADPLKDAHKGHDAREVRWVGATLADDSPTPTSAEVRWDLLRGWY